MTALAAWPALLLVLRSAPLLLVPGLSPLSRVPLSVRLALAITLALLAPLLWPTGLTPPASWPEAGVVLLGEFMVGVLLVFPIRVALGALEMMGSVVDMQMGIAAAAVIDPSTQQPHSIIAGALALLGTTLFFAFGLHTLTLQAVVGSYALLPGGDALLALDPAVLFDLVGRLFLLALAVVAPVIVALLVTDALLAYGSRMMPQANAYFVGLPLKLGIGFGVLAATLHGAGGTLYVLLAAAVPARALAGG